MKKTLLMAALAGTMLPAIAGLDRVYWNGSSWATANINANEYQALAQESAQAGPTLIVHGSRADGSGTSQIISGNWGTTWVENPINAVAYSKMASRIGVANQFYGLKADGTGIDLIYFFNNAWQVFAPAVSTGNTYKALTADATDNNRLFVARSDGTGVDRLFYNGSAWVVDQSLLSITDYKELATMTGVNNSFYAARADGSGLERVYWNGSAWVTQSVVSTDYKALAADAYFLGGPTYMVFGARADGTGVDRVRTDNNAATWFIESTQPSTKDYNALSTMHGVVNQFYGSTLSPAAPEFTSVTRLEDGSIELKGTGPADAAYHILATEDIALPVANWDEIGRGTFTGGVFTYEDTSATSHSQRFYRVVTP